MSASLISTGSGQHKVSSTGFFRIGPLSGTPPTDKGGTTNVLVADIIANSGNDITNQNYPASTKDTPIVFDGATYIYNVDGGDNNNFDTTTFQGTTASVEFTPKSGGTFFGNDGDIIRIFIEWKNWANGRWNIRFGKKSQYNSYSTYEDSFSMLRFNGNVFDNALDTQMYFQYFNSNNQANKYGNAVQFSSETINAFANSDVVPVIIDIKRLNNAQLEVTLRKPSELEFTNQDILICNLPTSTFNGSIGTDTNDKGIFVDDITHIYLYEMSGHSHVDYTIRKI